MTNPLQKLWFILMLSTVGIALAGSSGDADQTKYPPPSRLLRRSLGDFDWEIEILDGYPKINMNAPEDRANEVTIHYNYTGELTDTKFLSVILLGKYCNGTADGNALAMRAMSNNNGMFAVDIDINQRTIAHSRHYTELSVASAHVDFCVRVDYELLDEARGSVQSINFHEAHVTINVDLTANFTLTGIRADRADASKVSADAKLNYPVRAYFCEATSNAELKEPPPLRQGSVLTFCVEIDYEVVQDRNVHVRDILTTVISQPGGKAADSVPIVDTVPDVFTEKTCSEAVCNIQTQLASKFFASADPLPLFIHGVAILALGDGKSTDNRTAMTTVPISLPTGAPVVTPASQPTMSPSASSRTANPGSPALSTSGSASQTDRGSAWPSSTPLPTTIGSTSQAPSWIHSPSVSPARFSLTSDAPSNMESHSAETSESPGPLATISPSMPPLSPTLAASTTSSQLLTSTPTVSSSAPTLQAAESSSKVVTSNPTASSSAPTMGALEISSQPTKSPSAGLPLEVSPSPSQRVTGSPTQAPVALALEPSGSPLQGVTGSPTQSPVPLVLETSENPSRGVNGSPTATILSPDNQAEAGSSASAAAATVASASTGPTRAPSPSTTPTESPFSFGQRHLSPGLVCGRVPLSDDTFSDLTTILAAEEYHRDGNMRNLQAEDSAVGETPPADAGPARPFALKVLLVGENETNAFMDLMDQPPVVIGGALTLLLFIVLCYFKKSRSKRKKRENVVVVLRSEEDIRNFDLSMKDSNLVLVGRDGSMLGGRKHDEGQSDDKKGLLGVLGNIIKVDDEQTSVSTWDQETAQSSPRGEDACSHSEVHCHASSQLKQPPASATGQLGGYQLNDDCSVSSESHVSAKTPAPSSHEARDASGQYRALDQFQDEYGASSIHTSLSRPLAQTYAHPQQNEQHQYQQLEYQPQTPESPRQQLHHQQQQPPPQWMLDDETWG